MLKSISSVLLCICFLALCCCGHKSESTNTGNSEENTFPDTLKIGTIYGPTSYFIYRGDTMGYEYEIISKFGKDKGVNLQMVVAQNMSSLIQMLDSGTIDLIAYEIPITSEFKDLVLHCGNENITHQVLVQPKKKDKKEMITDVTQLVGKDVYVEGNSKYEARLKHLNEELGGGIKIHSINRDTLISEDLIEMVSEGKMPLTIVDSDIAKLNQTYFDNIDVSLEVSFPQRSSWAVKKGNTWLKDSIDAWSNLTQNKATSKSLLKRYFELSKSQIRDVSSEYYSAESLKGGVISPYDRYFKHYAKKIDWDWRLLAAQAYVESHFDSTVVSWAGARGIMQLMPGTARAYGLTPANVTNPELSIKAAVDCIADLDKSLKNKIPNKEERIKFILAAYNSGLGHIYDAIALADKYGKNKTIWEGNVDAALLLKSNPEYFNDEVCKFGYFKGKQTTHYVTKVVNIYYIYKSKIKL